MHFSTNKIEARLGRAPQRIAIFRALVLGDLLCAIPAVRALRRKFPDAEITLVGLPWARAFAARFNQYFDRFVEFPGYPGLPEIAPNLAAFPGFIAELQSREFDLAVQLHGSGAFVNPLVALFNAKLNAGFYKQNEWLPDAEMFLEYPENEPEIWRFLRLIKFLGVELQGDELEFPLDEKDEAEFLALAQSTNLSLQNYVCLHVGSQFPSRRWLPERYAFVADELATKGLQIVLTGTASEFELVETVTSKMRGSFINLCGKTSLGALGVLVKNARLVIANDTGIQHIAAGLKTPSVVVSLGSDIDRWLPLNSQINRAAFERLTCRPCGHKVCPTAHECATAITTEQVLIETDKLLAANNKDVELSSSMTKAIRDSHRSPLTAHL